MSRAETLALIALGLSLLWPAHRAVAAFDRWNGRRVLRARGHEAARRGTVVRLKRRSA